MTCSAFKSMKMRSYFDASSSVVFSGELTLSNYDKWLAALSIMRDILLLGEANKKPIALSFPQQSAEAIDAISVLGIPT